MVPIVDIDEVSTLVVRKLNRTRRRHWVRFVVVVVVGIGAPKLCEVALEQRVTFEVQKMIVVSGEVVVGLGVCNFLVVDSWRMMCFDVCYFFRLIFFFFFKFL